MRSAFTKFKTKNYMKASELRIGNLLEFTNGIQPTKVVTVGRRFFSSAAIEKEDGDFEITPYYRPIEITGNWLMKNGFVNHNNNIYSKPFNDLNLKKLVVYKTDDRATKWGVGFADYYTGKEQSELLPTEIQYVHQLQNLWYFLVGSELV